MLEYFTQLYNGYILALYWILIFWYWKLIYWYWVRNYNIDVSGDVSYKVTL